MEIVYAARHVVTTFSDVLGEIYERGTVKTTTGKIDKLESSLKGNKTLQILCKQS
jgi:hypothetical protein